MTTIDLEPLDHVTGGDATSDYGAAFNRDVHDVGTRLDRAKAAFVRGDAIGTIEQLGAADINGLRSRCSWSLDHGPRHSPSAASRWRHHDATMRPLGDIGLFTADSSSTSRHC